MLDAHVNEIHAAVAKAATDHAVCDDLLHEHFDRVAIEVRPVVRGGARICSYERRPEPT